jgi:DNA methylase N-4/N-6 domain protein
MNNNFSISDKFDNSSSAIICCNDTLDILKPIPNKSFDLIISSPPYNIGKSYEKKENLENYLLWQEEVISECFRTLKDKGSIVWQIGNFIENGEIMPLDFYFYPIFKKIGFKLRNRIIWHFEHGLHASKRLSGRYETVLWFTKSDNYTFNLDAIRVPSKYPGKRHYKGEKKGQPSGNPLGKNPSDYWKIITSDEFYLGIMDIPNVKANHVEKTIHPCQFPVELVERFVLALTDENNIILDPFSGVGSTAIAALKNNRRAMIIDKESIYCNIARERINKLENGSLKLRTLGKPVHKPTGKEKVASIPQEWIQNQESLL